MAKTGRPPSCDCGECKKCKHRAYMKRWYDRKTLAERREWIAKRDPERVKANDKARYERDKPKRLALNRKWARENRERVRELKRAWYERNPEKRKAQHAVNNAVRDGRLAKEPCEVCGAAEVHGHHDDYSKPLEVRWLCPAHHSEHHARQRELEAA